MREEINTRQQTWGAHRKTCENKSQHNILFQIYIYRGPILKVAFYLEF
jgi:hypothetical protein